MVKWGSTPASTFNYLLEATMITVSTNELKENLFQYLEKISQGETILVQQNKESVAKLVSVHQKDWREKMKIRPQLLVPPSKIIEPMTDIWKEYV
jgi:antitoxin (DNA-binding transcriptional repressor) of toxin-antitoxin stability system